MTRNQLVLTHRKNVRVWKHGELPMPDWVPRHMVSGIEANGTFEIETDLGHIHVHPGNVVVECGGAAWVCEMNEAGAFIEHLELHTDQTISNIGPGKTRQFGVGGSSRTKRKNGNDKKRDRRITHLPPVGSQPSIEWIHLNRRAVGHLANRWTNGALRHGCRSAHWLLMSVERSRLLILRIDDNRQYRRLYRVISASSVL